MSGHGSSQPPPGYRTLALALLRLASRKFFVFSQASVAASALYEAQQIRPLRTALTEIIEGKRGVRYCTAIVTVLADTPPILSTTGTALPVGAFSGTCTLT